MKSRFSEWGKRLTHSLLIGVLLWAAGFALISIWENPQGAKESKEFSQTQRIWLGVSILGALAWASRPNPDKSQSKSLPSSQAAGTEKGASPAREKPRKVTLEIEADTHFIGQQRNTVSIRATVRDVETNEPVQGAAVGADIPKGLGRLNRPQKEGNSNLQLTNREGNVNVFYFNGLKGGGENRVRIWSPPYHPWHGILNQYQPDPGSLQQSVTIYVEPIEQGALQEEKCAICGALKSEAQYLTECDFCYRVVCDRCVYRDAPDHHWTTCHDCGSRW